MTHQNFSQNSSEFITLRLVAEISEFHLREVLGLGGPKNVSANPWDSRLQIAGCQNVSRKLPNIPYTSHERFRALWPRISRMHEILQTSPKASTNRQIANGIRVSSHDVFRTMV